MIISDVRHCAYESSFIEINLLDTLTYIEKVPNKEKVSQGWKQCHVYLLISCLHC